MPSDVVLSLVDHSPHPMLVCDAGWRVVYLNQPMRAHFGWQLAALRGRPLTALGLEGETIAALQAALARQEPVAIVLCHRDGVPTPVSVQATVIMEREGRPAYILALLPRDGGASAESRQPASLLRRTHQGQPAAARPAVAAPAPLSVVRLWLDRLAEIEALEGSTGAPARRYLALLSGLVRRGDSLAQIGGGEFLLVLRAWAPDAWRITERLRAAAAQRALEPGWPVCLLSAGIASTEQPSPGSGPLLLRRAAIALEAARRDGGNCIRIAPVQEPATKRRAVG